MQMPPVVYIQKKYPFDSSRISISIAISFGHHQQPSQMIIVDREYHISVLSPAEATGQHHLPTHQVEETTCQISRRSVGSDELIETRALIRSEVTTSTRLQLISDILPEAGLHLSVSLNKRFLRGSTEHWQNGLLRRSSLLLILHMNIIFFIKLLTLHLRDLRSIADEAAIYGSGGVARLTALLDALVIHDVGDDLPAVLVLAAEALDHVILGVVLDLLALLGVGFWRIAGGGYVHLHGARPGNAAGGDYIGLLLGVGSLLNLVPAMMLVGIEL